MYASRGQRSVPLPGWERPVYMVHDHHSRSHHHDLRLEFDGVLRSWAVPKGLSDEVGVRRLAKEVPDHALEYAPFEGTIAEGSYGAGRVDIWDRGSFDVLEQSPDRLVLRIRGRKVAGLYHLVRAAMGGDRRNWLVYRVADAGPTSGAARRRETAPARSPRRSGRPTAGTRRKAEARPSP